VFVVLASCLLFTACGEEREQVLVHHDFAAGSGGWNTAKTLLQPDQLPAEYQACWISWLGLHACTIDVPVANDRMVLESPWWLDPNHAPPGAGYLGLVTWTYVDGEPDEATYGVPTVDLRGVTLRVALRAENLDLKGSHLNFWFQTTMPDGRFANFVYRRAPIEKRLPSNGSDLELVEITLSGEPEAWTCLSSAADRSDFYGCMDVQDAMREVDQDFGLILFPVSGSPLAEDQPSGRIEIQSFELVRK